MSARFFLDQPARRGERIVLDRSETKHARVRRLRRGDRVELLDGAGHLYAGTIDRLSTHGIEISVTEQLPLRSRESTLAITLAIALLKTDRLEWVIEKATELGVARVRPFVSQFSLARPSTSRRERWRHIAVAAAKQSGRSVVPTIDEPAGFDTIAADTDVCRLLFWPEAAVPLNRVPAPPAQRLTLIVGPEGGFADAEVRVARAAGCHLVGLGPRTLRAETAAIVAIALGQSLWGDLAGSTTA